MHGIGHDIGHGIGIDTQHPWDRLGVPPLRNVLTYGRFDGFDEGHVRLLRHLASLGSDVIVGCATDAFCTRIGRPAVVPYAARRAMLESCRYVARVIALDTWDQRRTDIVNYNVSALAVRDGPDQPADDLHDIVQVVCLPGYVSPPAPSIRHKRTG